jgi:hypothetical protein
MARPDVYKKRVYLGISDGFITERLQEATDDSVMKTRKDGTVYHELQYEDWTGIVTSIKLHEGSYDGQVFKSWNLILEDADDGEEFTLSVPMQSSNASSLYCKLEGADLSRKIVIKPYNFTGENGKKVVGLNIYQHGQKIEAVHTKDTMPVQPREKTGADAGKWDYSAVDEFLSGKFLELADKVTAMNPSTEGAATQSAPPDAQAKSNESFKDAPKAEDPVGPNANADADVVKEGQKEQEVEDDLPF